jgi:hypothetical protein
MSETEFFRDVDEELRRDQMKSLWDRFGLYVIGTAVLIVALTAGYRGWDAWQQSLSQNAGDRYLAAVQKARDGDHGDAETSMLALTADAVGGYPDLARLRAASEKRAGDDVSGAIAAFDTIAADDSVPSLFRDLAKIRAGYMAVDTQSLDEILKRMEQLTVPGNPWRHSAREIAGLVAWKAGSYDQADKWFSLIGEDTLAPGELKARGAVMLALIRSQLEAAKATAKKPKEGG